MNAERADSPTVVGPQSWEAFAGFALLYLVLGLVGRASVIDQGTVSLVWPAAGVSFLWLLQQPRGVRSGACLLAMSAVLTVVMLSTGASVSLTSTAVCVGLVQPLLAVAMVRRWCPGLLGAGGTGSVHDLGVLARVAVALLVASLVGAVIGTAGLAAGNGTPDGWDFVSWWARNLTGLMVAGVVGHLVWEHLRDGRGDRLRSAGTPELTVLLAVSATSYALVFTQPGLPLAFLVIPLSSWCALRFPTVLAAIHTAFFGSAAVVLTLRGRGPFGDIASAQVEAVITEAFLLTVMVTALMIGAVRDERAALVSELAASERAAGDRAEMLDAMTEAMTEGLAVVDVDGNLVRMNAACRDMLTSTPQGMAVNSHSYEFRRPDGSLLPSEEFPSARAIEEGTVPAQDVHLVFADGSVRVLSVNAAALTGGSDIGQRTGALVVYRDVTADRQDRSQLADFASTVAHDLRSPLTAIRGWLDLASAQLGDFLEEAGGVPSQAVVDATRSVVRAEKASVNMSTLIEELLAQATAEGMRLDLQPVVLSGPGGLVHEVTEMLPGDLHVELDDIPVVLADEELVRQLMSNLLGNAAKYADPDRAVQVQVTGEVHHHRVRIDVTDNGVGVPADQRERVFVRFHRAHVGDVRFSGTGLGLALCQTIVERHGGIIECLAAPSGVGTTFRFDLPLAPQTGAMNGSAHVVPAVHAVPAVRT